MYTIRELADAAGVKRRTIHHYIRVGLLPKPIGRNSAARYTAEHLWRLRMIRERYEANVDRYDLIEQFEDDDV